MSVNLSPVAGVAGQLFDNNGDPLTGGKILTYAAGTTTPQTTFTNASGTTPHSNPIILDAAGRVPSGEIWLTDGSEYKFVITDSSNVLIGTYDNIAGINSNFVNFVNQQEIQTATAGQTVFTLTTTQYQPGTNSLSVFVDGVNQYGPGASYAYLETNSTTVTFITGLHVGAEVKFTTSQINSSSATSADQVSYLPAGTGAVATNVQAKLRESVSVKDFGAVGDGVTDDTAAIQAALDSGAGGVYFPSGNYLVSSVEASSNTLIYGNGQASQLTASGTGNILEIYGVSGGVQVENVIVQNLSFLGLNNMSVGPLGCGVIIYDAVNITVDQCYFDSFGPGVADTATGGAALCFYVNCKDVTASNNTVVNGTGYLEGTDIALYSAAGYGIVTGNRTYSTNSQGIFTNAATKTGRIIITNNISRNHTRHGIVPVYSGTSEKIDTIVANNICEDCASTGIYVNTEADGVVIANNIVESCSGGGPNGYTLDGGISLLGIGKRVCIGNYINNTGYTSAGVQRVIDPPTVNTPTSTAGIRISNGVAGIVSGNVIVGGSGRGIDMVNGVNGVQVVDNTITNPEYTAIHIASLNNAGANCVIARNKIDVSVSDAMGIWHRSSATADQCFIEDNRIKGKKAATAKEGLRFEGNGITGSVSRNNVGNFDVGFNIQSVAMSTRLGDACVSDGNQLHDNTQGFVFLSDLTEFGFYTNFVFDGNGTDVVDAFARNTVRPAVSVSPVYLFYRSTFPTSGTWSVGDRVINTAPTVGQPKSWVCTVAGAPGTWVSEGNL